MSSGILFDSLKERIENLEKVINFCACKDSNIFPCQKCGPAVFVVGGDCYQQSKDKSLPKCCFTCENKKCVNDQMKQEMDNVEIVGLKENIKELEFKLSRFEFENNDLVARNRELINKNAVLDAGNKLAPYLKRTSGSHIDFLKLQFEEWKKIEKPNYFQVSVVSSFYDWCKEMDGY